MDIFVETFKLPDRDAVQLKVTYTIDGFAVQSRRGGHTRMRLIEVIKEMHICALKFIIKLVMSERARRPGAYSVQRSALPFKRGDTVSLPENGNGDFIDAEIVEE